MYSHHAVLFQSGLYFGYSQPQQCLFPSLWRHTDSCLTRANWKYSLNLFLNIWLMFLSSLIRTNYFIYCVCAWALSKRRTLSGIFLDILKLQYSPKCCAGSSTPPVINTFAFLPQAVYRQLLPEPTVDPGSQPAMVPATGFTLRLSKPPKQIWGQSGFPAAVWHDTSYTCFWPMLVCQSWVELGNRAFSLAGHLNAIALRGAVNAVYESITCA